jgi:hypothetical protein
VPDPASPQDLNRYAYVSNNPLRYIDPTGHNGGGPGVVPWQDILQQGSQELARAIRELTAALSVAGPPGIVLFGGIGGAVLMMEGLDQYSRTVPATEPGEAWVCTSCTIQTTTAAAGASTRMIGTDWLLPDPSTVEIGLPISVHIVIDDFEAVPITLPFKGPRKGREAGPWNKKGNQGDRRRKPLPLPKPPKGPPPTDDPVSREHDEIVDSISELDGPPSPGPGPKEWFWYILWGAAQVIEEFFGGGS